MVPPEAHLIWLGAAFPWVHLLALRSAAREGGFTRVVLHHDSDLSASPWWREVEAEPRVEAVRLDAEAVLEAARGAALVELYRRLTAPAARVNALRAALLHVRGGVYLDLDTVTVGSFDALRARAGAFVGLERLVFPAEVRRSLSPGRRLGALVRTAARDALRRAPHGWRAFRALEARYPAAANNAVLGAAPRHPLTAALLDGMLALPRRRQSVRFALGTHLLQDVLAGGALPEVLRCPPPVFYPLGPEISEHWFRADPTTRARDLLLPETVVVHWYASVRTAPWVPLIDPAWVERERLRRPLADLASAYLR